jgi:hypothetical protein
MASNVSAPIADMLAASKRSGATVYRITAQDIVDARWPGVRTLADAQDKAGWYWDTARSFSSGPFATWSLAIRDIERMLGADVVIRGY